MVQRMWLCLVLAVETDVVGVWRRCGAGWGLLCGGVDELKDGCLSSEQSSGMRRRCKTPAERPCVKVLQGGNKIGAEGAELLAEPLGKLTSLTSLDLVRARGDIY